MLHFRHIRLALALVMLAVVFPASAGDHLFPKTKPLFVGLDESKVPAAAKNCLACAKADFQRARAGQDPCHARFAGILPQSHSRVFEGKGYRITLVNKDWVHRIQQGPEILLQSAITGGAPYRYDEVEFVGE